MANQIWILDKPWFLFIVFLFAIFDNPTPKEFYKINRSVLIAKLGLS